MPLSAALPLSTAVMLPILLYSIVASVTPGPNNMMLLSSGLRFGVRRTVPHIAGIVLGGTFMVAMTGLGIAEVLARYPLLQAGLKWGGLVYLLWLAWQMTRMTAPRTDVSHDMAAPAQAGTSASVPTQTDATTATARPLGF